MQVPFTFSRGDLVIVHLPDPAHDNKDVVVPGVVVKSDQELTIIRIRDLSAHVAEIAVNNSGLSTR